MNHGLTPEIKAALLDELGRALPPPWQHSISESSARLFARVRSAHYGPFVWTGDSVHVLRDIPETLAYHINNSREKLAAAIEAVKEPPTK